MPGDDNVILLTARVRIRYSFLTLPILSEVVVVL